MSLDKFTTFLASCDFCSNSFDTDEFEFRDAVDRMKITGWRVFKKGMEWFHKCDDCCEKEQSRDFDVVT